MKIPERGRWLFRRNPELQRRIRSHQRRYLLPIAALVIFAIVLAGQVVPELRTRFGDGTPGTFTAQRLECQDECRWYGQFVSEDGRRRPHEVYLMDVERDDLKEGARANAIDTGSPDAVQFVEGLSAWGWWIFTLVFCGVGVVVSAFGWRTWLRDRRGRSGLDPLPGDSSAKSFP